MAAGGQYAQKITDGIVEYDGGRVIRARRREGLFLRSHGVLGTLKPPVFGDVYHFAAIVGGRMVIDGNPLAVALDLALDAAVQLGGAGKARPVAVRVSSAAYPVDLQGKDGAVALKESDIQFGGRLGQPDMTYGWSKLTGEYLARIAHQHYGLHTACVRPFSGYGEEQDLTYPVPSIALRAAKREAR